MLRLRDHPTTAANNAIPAESRISRLRFSIRQSRIPSLVNVLTKTTERLVMFKQKKL